MAVVGCSSEGGPTPSAFATAWAAAFLAAAACAKATAALPSLASAASRLCLRRSTLSTHWLWWCSAFFHAPSALRSASDGDTDDSDSALAWELIFSICFLSASCSTASSVAWAACWSSSVTVVPGEVFTGDPLAVPPRHEPLGEWLRWRPR
eukprot:7518424-Pyramimonas_sp.AAC.1